MFYSSIICGRLSINNVRNLYTKFPKRQIYLTSKNYIPTGGPEGRTKAKEKSNVAMNIDRPQTDNLLLSADEVEPKETVHKSQTRPDLTGITSDKSEKPEMKLGTGWDEKSLQEAFPLQERRVMISRVKSEHAVAFEEVPGPKSLKIVSDVMKNVPVIGMQTFSSLLHSLNHLILSYGNTQLWTRNIRPFNALFDSYGEVVCLRIPFCGDIVLVQRPEHISAIYNQRNVNNATLNSFDSLTEWHKRQAKRNFDMTLNLPEEIKSVFKENYEDKKIFWSRTKYHSTIEKTSEDFVKRIFSIRNVHDEVPKDFHRELNTWGLECMMQTLFGTDLGFYKTMDMKANDAEKTLQWFMEATQALQKCESGLQLWRLYNTRAWQQLTSSCDALESFLAKHIRMSKLHLDIALKMMMTSKNQKESSNLIKASLVKALILSGCVQPEQILTLCLDMMLIGVNAASTSLGFIFYHLSKSQTKQQKLFNEIMKVLPKKDDILENVHLQETPYLHACVTESLRLKHPIPYSLTRLSSSMILNKYFIPAGTYVMTANEIACLKEDNFDEPNKFIPERWLNKSTAHLQDAVVPLSEGTRTFLGRDWLHQQLAVATAKVVRNFSLEYHYGEIGTNRKVLSTPNKPFQFTFEERAM